MLKFDPSQRGSENDEVLRLWSLPDGTRCVLAAPASGFELRVIAASGVVRSAPCLDLRRARDIGQQWRVDFEISRRRDGAPVRECPECGDDGESVGAVSSQFWLHCPSCGHTWLAVESLR